MLTPLIPLAGGGILLRGLANPEDLPWITTACQDRAISLAIPAVPWPYTAADARSFADDTARGHRNGTAVTFVISRDMTPGAGLGLVTLTMPDPGDREKVSIGYWLAPQARGQGTATTAVRLAARWAIRAFPAARVSLTAAVANDRSCRVAERAGFTREGVLRAWEPVPGGSRRDCIMFSLTAGDLS